MKKFLVMGIAVLVSGNALSAPIDIFFEGEQFYILTENPSQPPKTEKVSFNLTVDFNNCTYTSNGEVFTGVSCRKDSIVWMGQLPTNENPVSYQTEVKRNPNGSYSYTFQGVNRYITSILQARGVK